MRPYLCVVDSVKNGKNNANSGTFIVIRTLSDKVRPPIIIYYEKDINASIHVGTCITLLCC